MKYQNLLCALAVFTAVGCFLCSSAGCSHNDSTYTSAPPVSGTANPAAVLPPGKKRLMGQMGMRRSMLRNAISTSSH